jgi:hypothetical protein
MTDTDPAITHLADSLRTALETEKVSHLREYLLGRNLPALGGDLSPSDILRRAIPLAGEAATVLPPLGRLLAAVITEGAEAIAINRQVPTERRHLLLNALDLAADLPAEGRLFASLKRLFEALVGIDDDSVHPLQFPLWQALVYQQVDASLEPEWFSILAASAEEWTAARRTLLLTAWRGLLWIPPEPEQQQRGEVVDLKRIARGLLALYDTVDSQEKGTAFLKACLDILGETYPRSSKFWTEHLAFRTFPEGLRALILAKWPAGPAEGIQELSPVDPRDDFAQQNLESLRQLVDEVAARLRAAQALQVARGPEFTAPQQQGASKP